MSDITELLDRWSAGDEQALHTLLPLVYAELQTLAQHYLRQERVGHTLEPAALVHEAYLRLTGLRKMRLQSRTHFYGAAATAMRRVLVDHARRRNAEKRGGGLETVNTEPRLETPVDLPLDVVALDGALERLAAFAPDKAKVVELRYFGGLSVDETAEFLGISPTTVKRHWKFARAFLYRALDGTVPPPGDDPE
jgi:RNA polymerase sigma-70 factor (ECF subfamily)